jgi:glyoxalase family protein
MDKEILGIHHVTAIAGDPQRNIDFYAALLGLRLVKLTVNFDDPATYHLYYGDELGHPGTILTFFPWPGAPKGRLGAGQLTITSFSIPETAIEFWRGRLKSNGVQFEGPSTRQGEQVLSFSDPDGLRLELIASPNAKEGNLWEEGPVPPEYALRGFYGVTLTEGDRERTASLLTETMGFRQVEEIENRFRYEVGVGGPGAIVDLLSEPDAPLGAVSVGTVHHVAWRTPDDEQQKGWRQQLVEVGLQVTPIIDRKYFHSIYFREPGGVLFEVATDPPGFTVDEQAQQLGKRLTLPSWLEPLRPEIERTLPPIEVPSALKAR